MEMHINLFANNTTFGVPYSSPPDNFTVGEGFGGKLYARSRFVTIIPVPAKTAVFADPVPPRTLTAAVKIRDDLAFDELIRWTDTKMVYLHPKLRFMPAEIFPGYDQIPLKLLATRNIAVLASDSIYQTLGEIGEQNRRHSFYHPDTAMHPELCDERTAELARLGFFRMQQGFGFFDRATEPVFNVSFVHYYDLKINYFDLATSSEKLPDYQHLINGDLLNCPIIEVDQCAQAACVSRVYSPTNKNHLLLIRPANTRLPLLKGDELIKAKYQAIIDQATAGQTTSSECSKCAKLLQEAIFFMAPYRRAITFCQLVIRELSAYQQHQHPDLCVAINKVIRRLAFSEYYMTDLSALIRQAIIYDELMQINNRNPEENLRTRQEENRKRLIDKEVEMVKAAMQQDIIPVKSSYFPMFNMHSLIMTSLVELLMDMREHNLRVEKVFRDKISDWKTEAQSICAESDDVLSNVKTMHSLKLMSTLISIEEQCAEDDGENH